MSVELGVFCIWDLTTVCCLAAAPALRRNARTPSANNDVFHMLAARRRYTHLWGNPAEGDRQLKAGHSNAVRA